MGARKGIIFLLAIGAVIGGLAWLWGSKALLPAEFRPSGSTPAACPGTFYDKSAIVFDAVTICATSKVAHDKLVHAANVTAQWLDNDADGLADNQNVNDALKEHKATLIMSANGFGMVATLYQVTEPDSAALQGLYGYETDPEEGRDASQEEIHHLIVGFGWAKALGDVFNDQSTTSAIYDAWVLADAAKYYQYDDPTCDVACKVMEFTYKATAAYLGSSADLAEEEFTLKSQAQLREKLPTMVEIFESDAYRYPVHAWPDGDYAFQENILFDPPISNEQASAQSLVSIAPNEDNSSLAGYRIGYAAPSGLFTQDIWTMNPDGSDPVNLTKDSGRGQDIYPEWSPDGEYLYYTSNKQSGDTLELYRVNATGTPKVERLSDFGREVRSLSVSPKNAHIALGLMSASVPIGSDLKPYSADLYLLPIAVMEQRLTEGNKVTVDDLTLLLAEPVENHIWHEQPDWQPGKSDQESVILYTRTQNYDNDPIMVDEIWQIRMDGSDNRRVLENGSMPRWTSDGNRFVTHEFEVADFPTGAVSALAVPRVAEDAGSASLSPDQAFLLFETSDTKRLPGIAAVMASGEVLPAKIIGDKPAYEPRWSPVPINGRQE